MNHATPQEWQAYIAGALASPRYEELEQHLYDCEDCLQQYIQVMDTIALANDEDTLPALSEGAAADFADRTLQAIQEASIAAARNNEVLIKLPPTASFEAPMIKQVSELKSQRVRTSLIRKPLFQYTVAAAATLLLLTTGVFQNIGTIAAKNNPVEKPNTNTQLEQQEESFSQRLMERTTSLLDNIHSNRTGGTPHE